MSKSKKAASAPSRVVKKPKEIKVTACVECGQEIRYDEISETGSMWESLRLDGANVALASSHATEDSYATCAHCCLEKERARLLRRGSCEIGAPVPAPVPAPARAPAPLDGSARTCIATASGLASAAHRHLDLLWLHVAPASVVNLKVAEKALADALLSVREAMSLRGELPESNDTPEVPDV